MASNLILKGFSAVRRELSRRKIQQEAANFASCEPFLMDTTTKLDILPLYEAVSSNDLQCGFGVSYLIRTDTSTLLFDFGNNPQALNPSPLENNMAKLGISLSDVDGIVLSHRHPDHVGGMHWWKQRSFSLSGTLQPDLGTLPIYVPEQVWYPRCNPVLTNIPTRLTEGIATTGSFTFYEPYPQWQIRPRDCEQTLVVNIAGKGLVLVVGCGHMGLSTLIERTKRLFRLPIVGIVGGLHYGKAKSEALQSDINLLKSLDLTLLALSPHDSYPDALRVFEDAFSDIFQPIRVGEILSC